MQHIRFGRHIFQCFNVWFSAVIINFHIFPAAPQGSGSYNKASIFFEDPFKCCNSTKPMAAQFFWEETASHIPLQVLGPLLGMVAGQFCSNSDKILFTWPNKCTQQKVRTWMVVSSSCFHFSILWSGLNQLFLAARPTAPEGTACERMVFFAVFWLLKVSSVRTTASWFETLSDNWEVKIVWHGRF